MRRWGAGIDLNLIQRMNKIMDELNVNEIKQVSGGNKLIEFLIGYEGGELLDAVLRADWSNASHNSSNPMAATNRLLNFSQRLCDLCLYTRSAF